MWRDDAGDDDAAAINWEGSRRDLERFAVSALHAPTMQRVHINAYDEMCVHWDFVSHRKFRTILPAPGLNSRLN